MPTSMQELQFLFFILLLLPFYQSPFLIEYFWKRVKAVPLSMTDLSMIIFLCELL